MTMIKIERVGGFAGYGGASSRLRADGDVSLDALSPADQKRVALLFKQRGKTGDPVIADGFRYRLSRAAKKGQEVIEVPESAVPPAMLACVKDRIV
jgi:hypothetical protein